MSENAMPEALLASNEAEETPQKGAPHLNDMANQRFVSIEDAAPQVISFSDMDGDGDKDIVVDQRGDAPSYWVENTHGVEAHAVFTQSVFKHIVPTVMGTGDIDSDGTLDIVMGYGSGAKIFLNDGNWSMQNVNAVMYNPTMIVVKDINEDGHEDILIQDDHNITLYQNVDGAFGAITMSWPDLEHVPVIGVEHIDQTNASLSPQPFNDKKNAFGLITQNEHSWQNAKWIDLISGTTVAIADMNNDGINDLFVQDEDGNKIWMESSGSGSVTIHSQGADYELEDLTPTVEKTHSITLSGENSNSLIDVSISPSKQTEDDPTPSSKISFAPSLSKAISHQSDDTHADNTSGKDNSANISLKSPLSIESEKPPFQPEEEPASQLKHAESSWQFDSDEVYNNNHFHPEADVRIDIHGDWWHDFIYLDGDQNTETHHGDDMVVNWYGANVISTGQGDDIVYAGYGDDTVAGGRDHDILFGEEGNDSMYGQDGIDYLSGGTGHDFMHGGRDQDALTGNSGNDTLAGGSGSDLIMGGSGDDLIYGGEGQDQLFGDTGQDTFYYASAKEGGDIVEEFSSSQDSFEFAFGNQATFNEISEKYDGTLDSKGESFIWETDGENHGWLYFDEDTSTAGNETLIAEVFTTEEEGLTIEDLIIVG